MYACIMFNELQKLHNFLTYNFLCIWNLYIVPMSLWGSMVVLKQTTTASKQMTEVEGGGGMISQNTKTKICMKWHTDVLNGTTN